MFYKKNWLNAVTTPQVSNTEEVSDTIYYGLEVNTTGNPSSALVILEGSIEGTNWVSIVAISGAGITYQNPVEPRPVKYLRVQLVSLSGGTSPSVSASVVATP